eukprot:jgi/Galph1/4149/GphlegSOOS_G2852.1
MKPSVFGLPFWKSIHKLYSSPVLSRSSILLDRSFHVSSSVLEVSKQDSAETGTIIDQQAKPSFRFDTLLVANRGEIACRVFRTAKRLGLRTVAVYSDADCQSLHVDLADEAVRIGPAPSSESYLKMDNIIRAAKETGAQVIHPGYGFLSENSIFAEKCAENDIAFVGPPVDAIQKMGSKAAARSIMETAGVPVVPGYHGDDQSDQRLAEEAKRIGFPVMIKPSMGGGGKGMKIVHSQAEFQSLLEASRAEASSSFGDTHILLEKYLPISRHIEVQIVADMHGNCVHLYERDCSVQRRHQKIIEEAPAPGISPGLRALLGSTAVAAAKAVGYVNAGTVEFILDVNKLQTNEEDWEKDPPFYFMEMNTRLQVEHPVTEMITGQDLVEWQLRVANEEYLPLLRQDKIPLKGHAIETRVYAENPAENFLPQAGVIQRLVFPICFSNQHAAVRVDSGIQQGDVVGVFYDPMIAKVICWGQTREMARNILLNALFETRVFGIPTNVEFVHKILRSSEFAKSGLDTSFLERNMEELLMPLPGWAVRHSAVCSSVAQFLFDKHVLHSLSSLDPWCHPSLSLFRLNLEQRYQMELISQKSTAGGIEADKEIRIHLIRLETSSDDNFVFLARLGDHQAQVRVLEHQVLLEEKDKADMESGRRMYADYLVKMKIEWSIIETPKKPNNALFNGFMENAHTFREWIDVYQVGDDVVVYREGNAPLLDKSISGFGDFPSDNSVMVARFKRSKRMLALERGQQLDSSSTSADGQVKTPMPGRVMKLLVKEGQNVEKGQPVMTLEAMKMTHQILCPLTGLVKHIHFGQGDLVPGDAILLEVEPRQSDESTNDKNVSHANES